MSSSSSAGSVTFAAHQRNHSMAADQRYGPGPGPDGRNGASGSQRLLPLPHIDDIIAMPDDIDHNHSVRTLLEQAAKALRLAEMSRGLGRPAHALKEYLRATIILVQVIAKHRDYPALQNTPSELGRQHQMLLKKTSTMSAEYTKIKQEIIADNKKTGVQPLVKRPHGGRPTGSGTQSGAAQMPPPPQPSTDKSAVKPGHGRAASLGGNAQDLLFSRFATLKGPQSVPGQDPRIKTHAIMPTEPPGGPPPLPPPPGPQGPRAMPSGPRKPTVDLNTSFPTLPKMPDAIYSPARGSISGDSPRAPPPSTPRASYSRTGSSTSLNTMASTSQQQSQKHDYFSVTQGGAERTNSLLSSNVPPDIAEKTVISAEELYNLKKSKASLLIIDVRPRDDFDAGHIWTQNTICIEPEILERGDQSAAQIGESLVISPSREQLAFDERSNYDVVVFHDQDSIEVPQFQRDATDLALIRLQRALTDFDYDASKLKNPPKLLQGGIDAWVDLMGPSAIQATSGVAPVRSRPNLFAHNSRQRRKSNYTVKLDTEEVKTWQEIVKQDNLETATSPAYVRSPSEFLRRYPPVISERESMTSSGTVGRSPQYGSSHAGDLRTELPTPPSRPPPALPRPSFTSASQSANDDSAYEAPPVQPQWTPGRAKQPEQGSADVVRVHTGLDNPGNWCYANSTLQALLGSPGFGRELADASWQENHKVPRKASERMEPPQLMTRIMSNLFHWMSTGKFNTMRAQTLMDYSRHVHKQNRGSPMFGGPDQQDASEFLLFLFDNLHEETNTHRNIEGQLSQQPNTKNKTILQAAEEYWGNYLTSNYSVVDRYWRGLDLSTVCCQVCKTKTHTFGVFDTLILYLRDGPPMTLATALDHYAAPNTISDFQCDSCKAPTLASQSSCIARMPRLLCMVLNRAAQGGKTSKMVTWDLNDFDFAPWFMKPTDANGRQQVSSPWRYECYAIVVHKGSTMYSGHYYTFVRDPNTSGSSSWLQFNDTHVSKVPDMSRVQRDWLGGTPFLLLFRRK